MPTAAAILALPADPNPRLILASDTGEIYAIAPGAAGVTAKRYIDSVASNKPWAEWYFVRAGAIGGTKGNPSAPFASLSSVLAHYAGSHPATDGAAGTGGEVNVVLLRGAAATGTDAVEEFGYYPSEGFVLNVRTFRGLTQHSAMMGASMLEFAPVKLVMSLAAAADGRDFVINCIDPVHVAMAGGLSVPTTTFRLTVNGAKRFEWNGVTVVGAMCHYYIYLNDCQEVDFYDSGNPEEPGAQNLYVYLFRCGRTITSNAWEVPSTVSIYFTADAGDPSYANVTVFLEQCRFVVANLTYGSLTGGRTHYCLGGPVAMTYTSTGGNGDDAGML